MTERSLITVMRPLSVKLKELNTYLKVDYKRQEGVDYMDQHHFIRFSSDNGCPDELCINFFALKLEYLEDGFADIKYFEASERYRQRKSKNLSWNIGCTSKLCWNLMVTMLWMNGCFRQWYIHYTYLGFTRRL